MLPKESERVREREREREREGKFIECENILVEGDRARRIHIMERILYCTCVMLDRIHDSSEIT